MKKVVLGLVLAMVTGSLAAATVSDDHTKLKAELAQVGLKVNSVADSVIPGVQQVLTDKGLFFAANHGQFLIEGNIYDLTNKQLVNDKILQEVRKSGIQAMQSSVIEFKAKDEKHVITVFTDTSCGYCRKLHSEIQTYLDQGITVRYLAFPRGGVSSETYTELQSIWCAKNPQLAMNTAKAGDKVTIAQCKNTVADQYNLGQSFGISGTPAIVLADGTLIPGYQPAAALVATLNAR
ncbi:thiol:disulfide interchange protein [Rheinheimera sp. SA_1]|uniref:bifunctional protein-disulfide isomerase/oxidoreductase DsbC n=1 Tax=Rheinheimera sp. SA_1 TaxID=1827365 RepID=UPI0007FF70C9|nr:bifunctional protein-disulfide isomerase/oxidoreductase DsbC [Rheinheimera sp. SA_1]OBP13927.1 thiol:disulfide interchange protein [Rheinheimera sp. SA_1]